MLENRINIIASDPLWNEIKKVSLEQDRSLSQVIRHALTEKFLPSESIKHKQTPLDDAA